MTRWLSIEQQRAWRSYLLATTLLMERLDRDLREKHALSMAEYEILVRLSEQKTRSLRMAELAASVKNSRSRTTHTVARMEAAGLVLRSECPSDRRGIIAQLTAEGYARLARAAPDHVESVRRSMIDVIGDEDMAVIGQSFAAMVSELE
ncbi:MAG: MarR family winged helix-turn-helix transcriptional regulator [Nocardioidaceae bacterium]